MRVSLLADVRRLPRAAWTLAVGALINRFGTFVLVFLALYLKSLGVPVARIGLVLGMYGVGALGASGAGGVLADALGRRNTIVFSMVSAACVLVTLAFVHSVAWIMVFTVLAGFCSELYRPAAAALLTDVTTPDQRVTAFALYRLAINLGMGLGPAVGGLLIKRSYSLLFGADALTSLAFGAVALAALPRSTEPDARPRGSADAARVVFSDRRFMLFLLASTLAALVYMQSHTTFPLQVLNYGHSARLYGLLLSLNGLIVVLIELPVTTWTRRRNPYATMFVGFATVAVGFGLTAYARGAPALAATVTLWTVGEVIVVPVAAAWVANAAPDDMRGRYQGAFGMTWAIGAILAPVIGARIFAVSGVYLWRACFVTCLTGGLIALSLPLFSRGLAAKRSAIPPDADVVDDLRGPQ